MIESSKYKEYHKYSSHHYEDILNSEICGCFYCKKMFSPNEIKDWIIESKANLKGPGKTAHCPYCGIDSVIGNGSNIDVNAEVLKEMNKIWF